MNNDTRKIPLTQGKVTLDLLRLVWSGNLVVGKNGVRFKGQRYGQNNSELLSRQGSKVRVAFNPNDLRTVHIYDSATMKFITIAEPNQLIAYSKVGEKYLREVMKQKSQVGREELFDE